MIRFTILLIAASCAYGLPKGLEGQEGRITGGSKAQPGQFPYQAAILQNGVHHCGGVILGQRWILTAQYCVEWLTADDLTIKVGTTTLDLGGDLYSVEKIIKHEDYDSDNNMNDIAMLRTKADIIFNDNVQLISLDSWIIDPNSDVVASGWGLSYMDVPAPNDLYFINLKTISTEECAKLIWWLHIDPDRHVCTFSEWERGVCQADQGGPVVHDGQLRGLITRPTCGNTVPDVHLDVSGYADWIIGTMDWD